jgi:hypothetical protein
MIGKPLPRQPIAWFWVAAFGLPAVYFSYRAAADEVSWWIPMILGGLSGLYLITPFLRKRETETTEIGSDGITQVVDNSRTTTRWSDVIEVAIVTTRDGPFAEDVFYLFSISESDGCVVTHDAAERIDLLPELHARFPGLDDKKVIEAMGCTSDNKFVLWNKSTKSE